MNMTINVSFMLPMRVKYGFYDHFSIAFEYTAIENVTRSK